jgi:hypothetical protein
MRMNRLILFTLSLCIVFALAACDLGATGDTNEDAEAAQNFFPVLPGYNISDADTVQEAISAAMTGGTLATGNFVGAIVVQKIDDMIDCYQEVGAADARIYNQLIDPTSPNVPIAGVLAVINTTRVRDNFVNCVVRTPLDGVFGAQSVEPEPCAAYGSFNFNDDSITFIYAATDQPLCDMFSAYFAQYAPQGETYEAVSPDASR